MTFRRLNADDAFELIPANNVEYLKPCHAIYVGSGGNLRLLPTDDGATVVFNGLNTGTILPVKSKAANTGGTSASDLVGLSGSGVTKGVAYDFFAVTPADGVALLFPCHAIYAGGTGTIAVVTAAGSSEVLDVVAGDIIPLQVVEISATDTTALNIVGLTAG